MRLLASLIVDHYDRTGATHAGFCIDSLCPQHFYGFVGGDATYVVMPNEVMEMNCLLPYGGDAWYMGSLAEPLSCVIGACHASYHTTPGSYEHVMGIRPGGKAAVLAGLGPMGLAMVDYLIHCDRQPSLLAVTDIDGCLSQ